MTAERWMTVAGWASVFLFCVMVAAMIFAINVKNIDRDQQSNESCVSHGYAGWNTDRGCFR